MSLDELGLKRRYRTGRDSLVTDFYIPILGAATMYKRAVGYFSSGSLAMAGQGLNHLIANRGVIRVIASPFLHPDDVDALRRGLEARSSVVERALLRGLFEDGAYEQRRLEYVSWMLAEGFLEMKIALMSDPAAGLFHEKIGWVTDGLSEVAFIGSANETHSALARNFESLSVYRGWVESEAPWVHEIEEDFDSLWANSTPELDVVDLPDAIREKIFRMAPADWHVAPPDPEEVGRKASADSAEFPMGLPTAPEEIALREYQSEAIRNWFAAGGQGILEMATGTGKTLTALALVTSLQRGLQEQHSQPLFMLIVCPYLNLVEQWRRELANFGVRPLVGSGDSAEWRDGLMSTLQGLKSGSTKFAAMITTNATLAGRSFQGLASELPANTLVVADEVHNLGTERLIGSLPQQARYRLGLSATPQRWMDAEGTARITTFFGRSVFELPLEKAIEMGVLCDYEYHPVLVELDEDERAAFLEVSEKIARLATMGNSELTADDADGPLRMLLFQRARLVGAARGKNRAALDILKAHRRESHIVVYCSDGSEYGADQGSAGAASRQIDQLVAGASMPPISMSVGRYTFAESGAKRAELERRFTDGSIQVMAAIRCLDEGVDIPSLKTALILASTTNPRQFIQRRGRVLRKAPGKDRAVIFDMIVTPGNPDDLPSSVFNLERRLFRKELMRVTEFAGSASNGTEVLHGLLPLRQAWNCLDV